ncbi:hypothetical protein N7539_005218 [Penicillium diatomitis]|uniref:Amine oxidase domain-containing protein n=1 Tax=Penicillium diatomitis TaxID=2819901 RepID=A0A9W9X7Q8_9EURO|nr:uncharacterized protein N7539_005218 [Penicillium diatomitis]KAJ5485230.1 hypothetical protein N7539_005218 [Penicillium diatomitis]
MRLLSASKGLRSTSRPPVSTLKCQYRAYNAAVIGAGVTGLTAAWQLIQDSECSSVTIYEKSNRLGGWLQSETIPVEGGEVVFEYGPRTLRSAMPASLPLLYLTSNLGLFNELITTSKRSPAALNRYIYYPDHLVRLPTPDPRLSFMENANNIVKTITTEPLFEGFITGLLSELFKPGGSERVWGSDESITAFISRRFNRKIADNLVSAVMHGIYAGNIDDMSAQTIMGSLRNLEETGVLKTLLTRAIMGTKTRTMDDFLAIDAIAKTPETLERNEEIHRVVKKASTFTFKRGTQQLIDGLIEALRCSNKVRLVMEADISGMAPPQNKGHKVQIFSGIRGQEAFDHVISAVPAPALARILDPKVDLDIENFITYDHEGFAEKWQQRRAGRAKPNAALTAGLQFYGRSTTVMVVNLYYKTPNLLPVDGFGYLIPRSVPWEQNPECGLGVIFASASSSGESPVAPYPEVSQDSAPGTKLTIMFGGHYWDGWRKEDYPDHGTAVRMAKDMLERHLGITEAPALVRTQLQENAIPRYQPFHMTHTHAVSAVAREEYHGRLVLVGNSFTGVGVGDCVRQGILAATHGVGRHELPVTPRMEPSDWCPWKEFHYLRWDMKGGIPTAPVRLFDSDI